jgi:carbon starvation protein
VVAGWGYFLIQGVRDPLGGINSLWPLFGIANQLLAAIALCLATTVILKMQLVPGESGRRRGHPALALVCLVPLAWLLTVTVTAGLEKISSADPRVGFLTLAKNLQAKTPALEQALAAAKTAASSDAIKAAEKNLRANKVQIFNQYLDATVAGAFLLLVAAVALICVWEWYRLVSRSRAPDLQESKPVWLPEYAVQEGKAALSPLGAAALMLVLLKELTGEAEVDRALANQPQLCCDQHAAARKDIYRTSVEARYRSIRRCC